MSIEVMMPQMGESVVEGTVTKWLVKEGDHVQEDQPLCEISTDKVDTEIPSPGTGVIAKLIAAEGETLPIGAPLALIEASRRTRSRRRSGGSANAAEGCARSPARGAWQGRAAAGAPPAAARPQQAPPTLRAVRSEPRPQAAAAQSAPQAPAAARGANAPSAAASRRAAERARARRRW